MESAIPSNLRCPRTRSPRASEDYVPPYPAWVARMKPGVTQVVMAYFGVQYRGDAGQAKALQFIASLREHIHGTDGPGHHDLSHYVDEAGFDTLMMATYWDDVVPFQRWLDAPVLANWWNDPARSDDGVGYFREFICPRLEQFEATYSGPDRFEGVALLAAGPSDEIQEHAYWGSARDRIPLSQTDGMRASTDMQLQSQAKPGQRVRVLPRENIALIRSPQDWTIAEGRERESFLTEIEPVLRKGMEFLRDKGLEVGCYVNRYMRRVDDDLRPLQKSFGMSFWRSLEHLERWAESHPTHLAIFNRYVALTQTFDYSELKMGLGHEVTVARKDEQFYEYVNCHPSTGLLRGLAQA